VASEADALPQRARDRGLPTPDRASLRALVAHERHMRDRTNVLVADSKVRCVLITHRERMPQQTQAQRHP
jgi:hypothetical protein